MKRIFIAGCGGMLGEAFYRQFKDEYQLRCTDIDINESWISELDIRDIYEYRYQVADFNPHYLFHLGAFTDLEYCEKHEDEAYITNTLSVENAALIANEFNIPILYIGTGGIFNGNKSIYDDWDDPAPLGIYARTKYMGERYVIENAKRYLICRAGWMMGGGVKDKKFIAKLMKQINQGAKELNVVTDKEGTPTYTRDFARNVKLLLEKEYWGLYNMACSGLTSRYEIAQELLDALGIVDKITINPVNSKFFKKEYFAPRPASEMLINRKLSLRGINIMRDWKTGLREYINEYYKLPL